MKFIYWAILLFFFSWNLEAQIYPENNWMVSDSIKAGADFGKCMDFDGIYGVVGSPGNERAYVLQKINTHWTQVAVLKASDGKSGQGFGNAVAIQGNTIVVGAPYDVSGISKIGAAYVFEMPSNGWQNMTQNAKLVSSKRTAEDHFGQAVGVYGNTVVVGAYRFSSANHPDCGRIFIFGKPLNGWTNMTETAYLSVTNESTAQYLGQSVDIFKDIIVAGEGTMSTYSAAYLFQKPITGWSNITETAKLTPKTGQATFGSAIDICEDEIVIGANSANGSDIASGAAYVFVKPSSGWVSMNETALLTSSDGMNGAGFGTSVSIQERYILAGANESYGVHAANGGKAYLFEKPINGWRTATETVRLFASNEKDFNELGSAVKLVDNDILVSAWKFDSTGFADCGALYTYTHYFGPQDIRLTNNSIEECSSIGDTIGTFSVTDGNMYDHHTYSLVQGDGKNDADNSAFFIRHDTLFNKSNLDYEKKNTYSIFVETKDTSNLTYREAFTVNIKNIAPVINDTVYHVKQLAPAGTKVGTLKCYGDTNSIRFTLMYNYGIPFVVDTFKAEVMVSNPSAIDPQLHPYFDLRVLATDGSTDDDALVKIYTDAKTSVSDISLKNVSFYPNPVKNIVYFNFRDKKTYSIEILNDQGRSLMKVNDFDQNSLPVNFLPAGMYFLKIDERIFRLVKQ